jgi:hypothetical protein
MTDAIMFLDRSIPVRLTTMTSGACHRLEDQMGDVVHVTRARVVKEPGRGMKTAYLDAFPDTPIPYGIHGGIKAFYKAEPEVERPATLDHLVMAVAG